MISPNFQRSRSIIAGLPVQLLIVLSLLISSTLAKPPGWIPSHIWSRCEPSCGPGVERRVFVCVQEDRYNTSTVRPDQMCGPRPQTSMEDNTERVCNYGDCERKNWWRVSDWSVCSQPCGDSGVTKRDVECVMSGSEGEIVIGEKYEKSYCDWAKRPASRGLCNRFNCPAEFQANEWQKCEQKDPCKSGVQRRQLTCHSLGLDGRYTALPQTACYRGRKPPPTIWRRCFVPEISSLCTQKAPVIDEVKMLVVQMRTVRRMRLQVGQEAYILPGTRLSINCPVKFFPGSHLQWRHEGQGNLSYDGYSNRGSSRFVSKSGRLVIRKFTSSDAGEWRCFAGEDGTSAGILLHYNLPSQGLSDWVARNSRRNTEMQNEDPTVVMTKQTLVQWVESPWSNCSVPCGGEGIQTRTVRCERLDTGVYHVLSDKECQKQFLVKPKTKRVCINLPKCPEWKLRNADYHKCTDNCVGIGRGTYGGYLACMLGETEILGHHCEQMTKPDISCENPSCQALWQVSDWSNCSVTCGGTGYQYREQKCVWVETGKPAGSACYDAKIERPVAVQECTTRPCKTLCVDLSNQCHKYRHWCGFHTFKYNCCKTCRDFAIDSNTLQT